MDREIATKTLAQLFLKQGNPRKALEIYLRILEREPANAEIREVIKSLKRQIAQSSEAHSTYPSSDLSKLQRIKNLEKWRENIRIIRQRRKNREKD